MAGFGGSVKLTGESEYKKALANINQSLKEVDSELKLVTSAYDKNDKSEAALAAQTDALTKKYDTQNKKVETIRSSWEALSKKIEESEKKHSSLGKELQAESDLLQQIEKEQGKNSAAYKEQADKVAKLSKEYDAETTEIDKNKVALSNMYVEMNKTQASANKTGSELNKLGKEADEASKGEDKTAKSAGDVDKETDKASKGGVSAFSVALGNLVSGAITSAISAMKDLANTAKESFAAFDDGRDQMIYATGATGEAAESLQQSYENVSKNVVADMNDIGKVIGEVNTRFGFTESQLEDASTEFLKFSKVTGVDAKTAVQSVSRAMEKAGMDGSELTSMLDMLLTASQKSGVEVGRLTDAVTKYSVPMKNLGFDTKDTVAIFAQFEKSGVNVEQAFNGLQKAAGNWAKEGKDAGKEFDKLMKAIKESPNDITATQKAVEVFGAKTGGELAAAIRSGKMEYSDMLGLISNSKGSLESTFDGTIDASDDLKLAWQGVKIELAKIVDKFLKEYGPGIKKAIEKIMPTIQRIAESVLPAIKTAGEWIGNNVLPVINSVLGFIKDNLDVILPILVSIGGAIVAFKTWELATKAVAAAQAILNAVMNANPIMLVVTAVGALTAGFIYLYKTNEDFRKGVLEIWNNIKEGAQKVWEWLKTLVTETIPHALYSLGETIVTTGANILQFIGELPMKIGEYIGQALKKATDFVTDLGKAGLDAIGDFVGNIIDGIISLPGDIKSKLDDILSDVGSFAVDFAQAALDAGKDFFEKIWNEVKDLPQKFVKLGKDCIDGFWQGFKKLFVSDSAANDAMKDLVKQSQKELGINSPSKVFANKVGKFSALGFGVGFKKEMKNVSEEMKDAIPTEFDISPKVKSEAKAGAGIYGGLGKESLVSALKEALLGVGVYLDDRKMGQFVSKTVTSEIYNT